MLMVDCETKLASGLHIGWRQCRRQKIGETESAAMPHHSGSNAADNDVTGKIQRGRSLFLLRITAPGPYCTRTMHI